MARRDRWRGKKTVWARRRPAIIDVCYAGEDRHRKDHTPQHSENLDRRLSDRDVRVWFSYRRGGMSSFDPATNDCDAGVAEDERPFVWLAGFSHLDHLCAKAVPEGRRIKLQ